MAHRLHYFEVQVKDLREGDWMVWDDGPHRVRHVTSFARAAERGALMYDPPADLIEVDIGDVCEILEPDTPVLVLRPETE